MAKGPVLIDLEDDASAVDVSTAPPVPDIAPPQGQAMQSAVRFAARKPSVLARWFWGLALAVKLYTVHQSSSSGGLEITKSVAMEA